MSRSPDDPSATRAVKVSREVRAQRAAARLAANRQARRDAGRGFELTQEELVRSTATAMRMAGARSRP